MALSWINPRRQEALEFRLEVATNVHASGLAQASHNRCCVSCFVVVRRHGEYASPSRDGSRVGLLGPVLASLLLATEGRQ